MASEAIESICFPTVAMVDQATPAAALCERPVGAGKSLVRMHWKNGPAFMLAGYEHSARIHLETLKIW